MEAPTAVTSLNRAINSGREDLLKIALCPQCLHQKPDNRVLSPCGHSLCIDCLGVLLLDQSSRCPQCNAKFARDGPASSFMKDFQKNSLIDLMKNISIGEKNPPKPIMKQTLCEECNLKNAQLHCESCQLNLCVVDDGVVHKAKVFQEHKRVKIAQAEPLPQDLKIQPEAEFPKEVQKIIIPDQPATKKEEPKTHLDKDGNIFYWVTLFRC